MKKNNTRKRKPTFLSFKMGKEIFAVSTKKVLEVQEKQFITPVPNSPEHIKGIINFRGDIVPVICLSYKFNLNELDNDKDYVIIIFDIIIQNTKYRIGGVADCVYDVISANLEEIKNHDNNGIKFDKTFLNGILLHKTNFVLMLNIDKVFETDIC